MPAAIGSLKGDSINELQGAIAKPLRNEGPFLLSNLLYLYMEYQEWKTRWFTIKIILRDNYYLSESLYNLVNKPLTYNSVLFYEYPSIYKNAYRDWALRQKKLKYWRRKRLRTYIWESAFQWFKNGGQKHKMYVYSDVNYFKENRNHFFTEFRFSLN